MTDLTSESPIVEWAVYYARAFGWRVFPSNGKIPAIKNWPVLATCDEAQIRAWWEQNPSANVSLATGVGSGVFAIDAEAEGLSSIDEYEAHSDEGLPFTVRSQTGGGGAHYLYQIPHGMVVRNSVKKLLPNVDVRGEGGQVILPPSVHPTTGIRYAWGEGQDPGSTGVARPTMELMDFMARVGCTGAVGERRDTSDIPTMEEMLAGISEGSRDTDLFRFGCQLRRKMAPHEVEALVKQAAAACKPPVAGSDLERVLGSIFKQDHSIENDPKYKGITKAQEDWAHLVSGDADAGAPEVARELEWNPGEDYPTTEYGNAMRLRDKFGDSLKYSEGLGWHRYNGYAWERDEAAADRLAQSVPGLVLMEADACGEDEPERRDELNRWGKSSQASAKRSACLREAQSMTGVHVKPGDFDRDKWLLNVQNGVLDLKTCQLRARRRDDLFTKIAPIHYEDGAACPKWREFIGQILPDGQTAWFIQKALGYSLTGDVSGKCFFILYGQGDNGKSMMLETLYDVIFGGSRGSAQSYAVRPHTAVIVKSGEQHDTVLASLRGARLGFSSDDVEPGDKLNERNLKKITGGDSIAARFMGKDLFEFEPQVKLWIATNERPGVRTTGKSMRTRARFVPFTFSFSSDQKRDASEVRAEFRAEASGILNWLLEGLGGYHAEGLAPSSLMADELDEYLESNDSIGAFIEEKCDAVSVEEGCTLTELFHAYESWAAQSGAAKYGRRTLANDLAGRPGVERSRAVKGQTGKYGLRPKAVNQYGI